MEDQYDVIVIGAGVLGCFMARNLMRYRLKVALLEQREDVCTGISRANTAIVYAGFDNRPGSLKSRLCMQANKEFDRLCGELGVRFSRCGSLMVTFGPGGMKVLQKKWAQGQEIGLTGLRMLDRAETLHLEPGLNPAVYSALYSPHVGTVNPWELGIAAAENAVSNGTELFLHTQVTGMRRNGNLYLVSTPQRSFCCRAVINCAGLMADEVSEMIAPPAVRIVPTMGDYYVLDTTAAGRIHHVVFHEPEERGKGLTLVPTVDGNILVGPSERPAVGKEDWGTAQEGLDSLRKLAEEVVPALPMHQVIRSFSAIRPNPFWAEQDPDTGGVKIQEKSIPDFSLYEPKELPGFFGLIGIKTPGLTCADTLGRYLTGHVVEYLDHVEENKGFSPRRGAPVRFADMPVAEKMKLAGQDPAYGRIVCRCRQVTEGEIVDAIRRRVGATTLDGVKRRTGSGTGRCQGSFCTLRILQLLAREHGVALESIEKDGSGSWMVK